MYNLNVICVFLSRAGQVKWMTSCKVKGKNFSVCVYVAVFFFFFFKIGKPTKISCLKGNTGWRPPAVGNRHRGMEQRVSTWTCPGITNGSCEEAGPDSGGLRFCISYKLPGDAGAAGPQTHSSEKQSHRREVNFQIKWWKFNCQIDHVIEEIQE